MTEKQKRNTRQRACGCKMNKLNITHQPKWHEYPFSKSIFIRTDVEQELSKNTKRNVNCLLHLHPKPIQRQHKLQCATFTRNPWNFLIAKTNIFHLFSLEFYHNHKKMCKNTWKTHGTEYINLQLCKQTSFYFVILVAVFLLQCVF